jgi:hypothetical protein
VEYDIEREVSALFAGGWPRADWTVRMLRSAGPLMP